MSPGEVAVGSGGDGASSTGGGNGANGGFPGGGGGAGTIRGQTVGAGANGGLGIVITDF